MVAGLGADPVVVTRGRLELRPEEAFGFSV